MMKSLIVLCVAVLSYTTPAASADSPEYDCGLRSVRQDTVTGQSSQGVLYGYAVHAADVVSIRCDIKVNGVQAASTPTAVGRSAAVTAGDISYYAGHTDVVQVCASITTSHSSGYSCSTVGITQIPDLWEVLSTVFQSVGSVFTAILDPTLCPVFASASGEGIGPVAVNSQGDVYVADELYWDCPPYEDHG